MGYYDKVVVTLDGDVPRELREILRVGVGDAILQELGPLIEQHTRRMMTANIYAGLCTTFKDSAAKPEGRAALVRDALWVTDLVMKETK